MSNIYEFYDPFKNPKVSVQNEQNSILPPQWNVSQNDTLAQKVRNLPSNVTPNYNLYKRGNFGQNAAGVGASPRNIDVFKASYPQNNFDFEPWEPYDFDETNFAPDKNCPNCFDRRPNQSNFCNPCKKRRCQNPCPPNFSPNQRQSPCHRTPPCDCPSPPIDDCQQPFTKPPLGCRKPRLCPRCGLPKNMCRCFPQKFDHCFPNFVCFPVSPFPPCAPFDNNLQFGINFSSISMPQYDDFQSQKSFMFWLGKNCYC